MNKSTILDEAQKIQEYLDVTCSENPEEIQERIRMIMPYISRTGLPIGRV